MECFDTKVIWRTDQMDKLPSLDKKIIAITALLKFA